MVYRVSRSILWLFFKICFGYRAKNAKNIPASGPVIMASNHLSFLDPGAVGLATNRRVSFMARASLFHKSLLNWWAQSVGVVQVDRGKFDLSAIKGCLKALKDGRIVALFPEGTRSKDGTIKDPKGGVGFLAVKANVPVVPVFIRGSDKALPAHAKMIRLKRVEARVGKPIYPKEFLLKSGVPDYEAFSKEVMRKIEELGRD